MFENGVENDMRSKLLDVISQMKDEITRCHKYRKKCFNKCVGVAGSEEGVIRASFSEIKNSLKKFESHLAEASNLLKPESVRPKPQKSDESDREREKSPERADSAPAEKFSKKALLEEVAEDSGPEKKVSKVEKRENSENVRRPPSSILKNLALTRLFGPSKIQLTNLFVFIVEYKKLMKNLGIGVLKIARKSQLTSLPKIAQKAYK